MKIDKRPSVIHRIAALCCGWLLMLLATTATAQTLKVTGTVTDELGEPIIGANVVVPGT